MSPNSYFIRMWAYKLPCLLDIAQLLENNWVFYYLKISLPYLTRKTATSTSISNCAHFYSAASKSMYRNTKIKLRQTPHEVMPQHYTVYPNNTYQSHLFSFWMWFCNKTKKKSRFFFMRRIQILHETNMIWLLIAHNSTSCKKFNNCFASKKCPHFTKHSCLTLLTK